MWNKILEEYLRRAQTDDMAMMTFIAVLFSMLQTLKLRIKASDEVRKMK